MSRTLLLGAAMALTLAGASQALAQAPAQAAPPPNAGEAKTPDATGLKVGMRVVDATGAEVGSITQVGAMPDGKIAVAVNVDGKTAGLLASNFTLDPSGDHAVSALTKAQILAALAPRPG